MNKFLNKLTGQAGYGLVEVAIAFLILVVALVILLGAFR